MKNEKTETVIKNRKNNKEKFSCKVYLRNFLLFVDKYLLKKTGILIVIAFLLVAVTLKPIVSNVIELDCVGTCSDGITLWSDYSSKLQVLLVTLIAGVVPYMYAPVVGFLGCILTEVFSLAYAIKGYGYLVGILFGTLPILLNILSISIVTAAGIYACKTVTVGYRISSVKNMNFTNFKIRLYETMRKEDKVKELTQKRDSKIQKLESKKEKLNYLQILNTSIIVCIIQFVSVLIQHIIM